MGSEIPACESSEENRLQKRSQETEITSSPINNVSNN